MKNEFLRQKKILLDEIIILRYAFEFETDKNWNKPKIT